MDTNTPHKEARTVRDTFEKALEFTNNDLTYFLKEAFLFCTTEGCGPLYTPKLL